MAENYIVNYKINVDSDKALSAIRTFQEATSQMEKMATRFDAVAKGIGKVNSALSSINTKGISVNIDTSKAEANLNKLLNTLNNIKRAATVTVGTKATTLAGASPLNTKIATSDLTQLQKKIQQTHTSINGINKRRIHVKSDLVKAQGELDRLLNTLQQIKTLTPINISAKGKVNSNVNTSSTGSTSSSQASKNQSWFRRNFGLQPNAHQYLGNVYAGTGLGMAGEFVKGMGMTYALSGLISGIRSIFVDSAEYDNITKSTRNILATHDNQANFNQRFDEMNRLMRQVGIETKFTAPQVADAGRFLAMAGLNIEEIKSAIRPIADIALVGDTELGETADVVTNIMTAYQIPAQKMNRVADILTSTFTSANVTLLEMAESFQYSASLFKKAGVPFEVAAASLGILGDAGIKGSQAGTTMRTILSNIYNPTKKQKAAWERLGVNRLDENGNVRDVIDLFMDLNTKNIDIRSAYSMFHKTAAQGAVALANAVDKWNAIIADNFLSDALAQKLANEKKNTIQGLWYQITSAFTESGMQQFEKLQAPIRGFMNQVLEIMKSSDFANSLQSAMSLSMTVMDGVGEMAKTILTAYSSLSSVFQGWVQFFIKFQMWVGLFNGVQTMLISTFKGVQALLKIGLFANIVNSVGKFGELARKFAVLNGMSHLYSVWYLLSAGIKNLGHTIVGWGPKILNFFNTGWLGLLGGAKILFPLGGFAALAGGIWWIHNAFEQTTKKANAYMQSISVINGISMSEHASMTDKYLSIVHDKQKSANEKLQEYIKLRREELGLIKSGIDSQNVQTFGEQFAHEVDIYDFSWWRNLSNYGIAKGFQTMRQSIEKSAERLPALSDYLPELTSTWNYNTNQPIYHAFGKQFTSNSDGLSRLAASHLLFIKGTETAEGSEANLIREEFNQKFFRAKNAEEIQQVWGEYYTRRQELLDRINPAYNNIRLNELKDLPEKEWKTIDVYVKALVAQMDALMGVGNLQTANSQKLDVALALITKFSAGETPTAEEIQSLLRLMRIEPMGVTHGVYTSPNWGAHLGYDAKTGQFGNANMTAQTAQENIMAVGTHIQEVSKMFDSSIQLMFKPLLGLPIWGKAGAGLSVSSNKKYDPLTGALIDNTEDNNTVIPTSITNPLGGNDTSNDPHNYQYGSTSSAPKQVIVRIENLMNVENIDLTDERKAAVINNLKDELATALLDVVQDFNANMS